ncbi:MAG: glycerol-3-phosphate dehydrogenase [Omnitrophica bacterium RIFCSPHIGHO2_02_FULL_46_20]|nr:MAG: glycerol-3-phosphate dehydrogenase [Omnitrophica bacterium RIFCSPHIGHO2_02_FULL_46_20]
MKIKNTRKNIGIVGDGGWGTTLAVILAKKGCNVTLWGAFPDYIKILKTKKVNTKFLPGIRIPDEVEITSSLDDAINRKDIVVLAAPSQYMRPILTRLAAYKTSDKIFVSVTKGIENKSLKRMSEIIREILGEALISVLSGPTIAREVAQDIPTTIVASSQDIAIAKEIQSVFMTDRFRVYTNSDIVGVELGGSLKNTIAIAAGISDALGFGTNAKAALLTRGLVEMARLGVAMGAKKETFYGLSGLGDLATTCISLYSRNRRFGEEIGKGKTLKEALKETEMVVEGVATTESAHELANKNKIEMPITEQIYKVLYEDKDPKKAVHDLMTRSPKKEGVY